MARYIGRGRIRLGKTLVKAGAATACALIDLGVVVAPGLSMHIEKRAGPRALPGLFVVFVVILALAFVGQNTAWAIREAVPHREVEHAG